MMDLANEPDSTPLPDAKRVGSYKWNDGATGSEWDIGPYQVCTRMSWPGQCNTGGGDLMMLQVCRADGGSVFDWRHLQEIKNKICGKEWEAVEIFPAESRLRDPSNARYLWASRKPIPFGFTGRFVLNKDQAFAPQRGF